MVVVLAAVPVILLGIADLLARAMGIAPGWTMLMTGIGALVLMGLILYLSVHELIRSLNPLRRSHEELVRNLAWLRTVLVYSDDPAVRERVRIAVGRRPDPSLAPIDWLEAADGGALVTRVDQGVRGR